MKTYKARLKLTSALGTPLAADTLFGHICWSMVYDAGTQALGKFLGAMDSDEPPIILSDPFPADMLPVPVLPRRHMGTDNVKDLLRIRWLPTSQFQQCQERLSFDTLIEQLARCPQVPLESQESLAPHNHVSRLGGGTVEGGIFFTEDMFVDSQGALYDLYILSDTYTADQLHDLLTLAVQGGYGRDKSTGRGTIEVQSVSPMVLPVIEAANAVMLLGPCVPATSDPLKGYWNIRAKAGKLGGHWAITENPHKKTVMMIQAGSVLLTDTAKPFYGRMVHNVHPDIPDVVHYGIAPAIPVRIVQDSVEAA